MVSPPEQLALDAELLGIPVNALQPGEDD
jgi:hypothetical protein